MTALETVVKVKSAIRMEHITKRFGDVVANHDINLELRKGEILSLLGENGSGKTTLMNMLSGIYHADEGQIYVNDQPVDIGSPKDSFDLGIGMIHQHFKLVDVFTATENIVLGLKDHGRLDLKEASKRIEAICQKYGFEIDLTQKIYEMSVSQKQTVEIVKVLFRGADILILDEPTAVLTPQETEKLFTVMRNMRDDGKSLIIITHKLHEVLEISDRVAVLRKGEYIGSVPTSEATMQSLTDMMVGRAVSLNIDRPEAAQRVKRLEVRGLTVRNIYNVKALDDVTFDVYSGEILGVAGISGCGQKELLEALAGLQKIEAGSIRYYPPEEGGEVRELAGMDPMEMRRSGVSMAFVPEDRLGMGLVGSMGMADNMMLRSWNKSRGIFLDRKGPEKLANRVREELEVVTPSIQYPVRRLSGGNVQKVLVGREIAQEPAVLMTAYAVRGLDINTSYTIYNLLTKEKMKGVAVIFVGEDLDVLLELCDRILVLCGGRVSGIVDGRKADKMRLGAMMTHLGGGSADA